MIPDCIVNFLKEFMVLMGIVVYNIINFLKKINDTYQYYYTQYLIFKKEFTVTSYIIVNRR